MSTMNPITGAMDWETFLSRHDMVWDRLPRRWENGIFLGNGLLGTLIHADFQLNRVRWWICRSDVGRMGPSESLDDMIPRQVIGSLDVLPVCDLGDPGGSARLQLLNAEASGEIKTFRELIQWNCFVPETPNVVILELNWSSDWIETGCHVSPTFQKEGERTVENGVNLHVVPDLDSERGGGHAVAWRTIPLPDGRSALIFSAGSSPSCRRMWKENDDGRSAKDEALAAVESARAEDLDAIRSEHRRRWRGHYSKSFVSFGDAELESHYWIQLYKLRSTGRAEAPMIGNHGLWSVEKQYGFDTWDMNVQATYRLHLPANHVDVGEALIRFLRKNYTVERMRDPVSGELRAGVTHNTFLFVPDLHKLWEYPCLSTANAEGAAKFLWACHNVWLQYRFTMDRDLLTDLANWLEGGINTYVAHATLEEDGKLHVDDGFSWEAVRDVRDPTCYIAIMAWALRTRMEIDGLLGWDSDPKWTEILDKLPTYPVGEEGYLLAPGHPPVAHRHWSHLMQIWPFHTVNWDDPDARSLIQKSVDLWADLSAGPKAETPCAGFAVAAAMELYAHMGQSEPLPDLAEVFMREWTKRGPCCWASTLYRENGPVIESPLLLADALLAAMIQSWNGVIRVFPAWPGAWGDVVFADLRAEGGFSVSAARSGGAVTWIAVANLAGAEPCQIRIDMPDFEVGGVEGDAVQRLDDGLLAIDLPVGEMLTLTAPGVETPLTIKPVETPEGNHNAFGLNERFLKTRRGKERVERLKCRGRGLLAW